MSASIETILSHLNQYQDLQRQSRFKVFFPEASLLENELLSLRCEAIDIPGRTLDTFSHRTYGPVVEYPKQSYFGDITLTFICSSNFSGKQGRFYQENTGLLEKRFFENWMQYINTYPTNSGSFNADYAYHNFKYKDEYAQTIDIICYDTSDKISFKMSLLRAFPTRINPVSMTWTSEDVARLPVTFSYETFTYSGQTLTAQQAENFDLSTTQSAPPTTIVDAIGGAARAAGSFIGNVLSGIFR